MVIIVDSSGKGKRASDMRRPLRGSVRFESEEEHEKRIQDMQEKYAHVKWDAENEDGM